MKEAKYNIYLELLDAKEFSRFELTMLCLKCGILRFEMFLRNSLSQNHICAMFTVVSICYA